MHFFRLVMKREAVRTSDTGLAQSDRVLLLIGSSVMMKLC